ncbi:MAG: Xaa-Pro peptidase family protein [bacterium]
MAAARLIVGSSERDADLLYATHFFAPDEMVWFFHKGRSYALLSRLEIDRARATAKIDRIFAWEDLQKKLERRSGKSPKKEEVILDALRQRGINRVEIPEMFPVALADFLRKRGVKISIREGMFFPKRQIKTPAEIKAIEHALHIAEAGLERALGILRAARIAANGLLRWNGQTLTSEILRGEIDAAIVRRGGLPSRTIVACGKQACDPHEMGSGPLRAHSAIMLDIFPRDQKTGYFGDLTRTVVKGRAPAALKALYETVKEGQDLALKKMKPGVDGKVLHKEIVALFERKGFKTQQRKGRWVGFFHGTGHSLGLEIHEPPRFSQAVFQAGHVMTVEPGLYFPSIGGVRLEDLVVIKTGGIRNLTRVERRLEI